MALSSLSVVGNANRLRRYHPVPLPDADVTTAEPLVQTSDRHDVAGSAFHGAGHGPGATEHSPRRDHGERAPGRPAVGRTETDPVCGMEIDPATAAQHRDTSTGTVHFCSAGCAAAFDAGLQRHAATTVRAAPGEATR